MCYPMDIDVARDMHAERSRALEVENRLTLRAATSRDRRASHR